jgi:hypothetical protein
VDQPTLYRRFGEFLAQHAPNDVEHPTQKPGVIKSAWD